MKIVGKIVKFMIIIVAMVCITKVNIEKDNGIVLNDNTNKVLDLTAMAYKIEQIKLQDLNYPLDTYVGYLTGYAADCPLCGGTLGCTGQNVLDGTTTYFDNDYGTVGIVASSTNLACGSIVRYKLNDNTVTAIVLDRGVTGTNLDLLVSDEDYAFKNIGRKYISYDILRFGWSR